MQSGYAKKEMLKTNAYAKLTVLLVRTLEPFGMELINKTMLTQQNMQLLLMDEVKTITFVLCGVNIFVSCIIL